MKALIRNTGETVTEAMGVEGIDWMTGAPLTDRSWRGGPYTLVQNYTVSVNDDGETYEVVEQVAETVTEDTVVIDGKEYTKEELRALLGE